MSVLLRRNCGGINTGKTILRLGDEGRSNQRHCIPARRPGVVVRILVQEYRRNLSRGHRRRSNRRRRMQPQAIGEECGVRAPGAAPGRLGKRQFSSFALPTGPGDQTSFRSYLVGHGCKAKRQVDLGSDCCEAFPEFPCPALFRSRSVSRLVCLTLALDRRKSDPLFPLGLCDLPDSRALLRPAKCAGRCKAIFDWKWFWILLRI